MTAWVLRKASSSVRVDPAEPKFLIQTNAEPPFHRGDDIVLAGGRGKTLSFDYSAKITGADSSRERAAFTTIVAVDEWRKLPDETTLELMQFSLTIVRNLDRPDLHFRRAYRRLPPADLATIRAGEPFVERSAYYLLLRCLPDSLREEFQQEGRQSLNQMVGSHAPDGRLRLLLDFLHNRVLSVGRLLERIDDIVESRESLSAVNGAMVTHEFWDHAVNGTTSFSAADDIHLQTVYFREFENILKQLLVPDVNMDSSDGFSASVLGPVLESSTAPAQRRLARVFPNG